MTEAFFSTDPSPELEVSFTDRNVQHVFATSMGRCFRQLRKTISHLNTQMAGNCDVITFCQPDRSR